MSPAQMLSHTQSADGSMKGTGADLRSGRRTRAQMKKKIQLVSRVRVLLPEVAQKHGTKEQGGR